MCSCVCPLSAGCYRQILSVLNVICTEVGIVLLHTTKKAAQRSLCGFDYPEVSGLVHVLATVDGQRRASDKACFVSNQEQYAARDVFWLAQTSDWDSADDLL